MSTDQTILHDDPARQGNCLSAAVASFLHVDLEEVPHFAEYAPDDKDAWWHFLLGFMAGHGYWCYDLPSVHEAEPGEWLFVMGPSPRGVMHQVIYRDGELFHDPHPSRAGVTEVKEVLVWRPVRHDHTPSGGVA